MSALKRQVANWLRVKANELDPPRHVSFEYSSATIKTCSPSESAWSRT